MSSCFIAAVTSLIAAIIGLVIVACILVGCPLISTLLPIFPPNKGLDGSTKPAALPIILPIPLPAILNPIKAIDKDKIDLAIPEESNFVKAPIKLLTISNPFVNPSTTTLIALSLAIPMVKACQALCNLFSLASNESIVLPNCSSDAPALLFAALINSIVLS